MKAFENADRVACWFGPCLFLLVFAVPQKSNAQLAGVFRSAPGTMATYEYDFGGLESVLLPADMTVSFSNDTPTSGLTATIHQPFIGDTLSGPDFGIVNLFPMTVTGTSADGRRFQGDLLGTQYLFDWTIEPAAGGELSWNGTVYWAGGHIERSTITNARLVAVPEPGTLVMFSLALLSICSTHRGLLSLAGLSQSSRYCGMHIPRQYDRGEISWHRLQSDFGFSGDTICNLHFNMPSKRYRFRLATALY